MTVEEIINRVRGITDDTVSPYLWSNADIVSYLNSVIEHICIETHLLIDAATESCCKITLTKDQADYALHASVIHVINAIVEGQSDFIYKKDMSYLNREFPTWRSDDSSTPLIYVLDKMSEYISLYPAPDENGVLWLTVSRFPLTSLSISEPAQQSELDAVPGIPVRHHDKVINGILYWCYEKRDEDTYNPQLSSSYKAKYDNDIEEIKRTELKRKEHDRVIVPSQYHS